LNLIRSPQLSSPHFPGNIYQLASGLTIIHQHIATTEVVAVDVWVRAGASVEPDEWIGMAHFLEHMIFKGTERLAPGDFDYLIENRGGMTNAATSQDYAHFFITTAAAALEDTLPHLAELLLNATIPADEFGRERDVVLEELNQTLDNPDWLGFQALTESVYQRHPYGRPILGTAEILLARSPAEMRQFHRAHYQPHNMTVVIVGDVDEERVLRAIERSFATFQDPLPCPVATLELEPPIAKIRRQELRLPRLEQARLMMAWLAPGASTCLPLDVDYSLPWNASLYPELVCNPLQDAYGLDILSAVLSEGRTSRLVQELREERHLVQDISSSFSLQRDSSLFTITAWLEPQELERVEALICDRLDQLSTIPITVAELARCQRLLCNDYAFSTETPSQLAGLYGYYQALAQAEIAVTYPQRIQAFNVEDLQAIASDYLSPYRYAATVLKPL
jgi:zinc protease